MAEVNRIDSIYNVDAIEAEQKAVERLVLASVEQIKQAREQSIDFSINTKNFQDYHKKISDLNKTMTGLAKTSDTVTRSSILLAKQKEAEAKAMLASTRATSAAAKETERAAKATKTAADKAAEAGRPYKQLALAFAAAAKNAQDLAAKYGVMDKRAQAAARTANQLNNQLKAIDASIGNHQRNVGNYGSALQGVGNKIKGLGAQFLAFAGLGSFFSGAINEFVEMDKNVRILENTLRNVGVPEAFGRMEDSANKLAKQFAFLDNDDILKSFNQLVVYGKLTENQINDLIPVIIDFATAQGLTLPEATSTVIKALEGNGRALKEYGIDIKDAKSTTEAFGIIMTQLAPKVEGVGEAFGETASGGLAAARQEFKNLQEEVGGQLVPILATLLGWVNKLLTGFKFLADEVGVVFSDIKDLFGGDLGVLIGEGEGKLKRTAEQMARVEKLAAKGLADVAMQGKSAGEAINELNQRLVLQQTALKKAQANISGVFSTEDVKRYEKAVRVTRLALAELFKLGATDKILGGGDPNKAFNDPAKIKEKQQKIDNSEAERRKANLELYREFDLKRLEDEKKSYQERTQALIDYGNDSAALIELQAANELAQADLSASQRLKIENDKNNALIRLSQELADKLAKLTARNFQVDTSTITSGIKGLPAEIQKALDDYKKAQDKAVEDHEKALEQLHADTKDAVIGLASELEGLFFDIFTNAIEREKNAIQDQIDLLDAQARKDKEVADQTITNVQEKEAAIAVIEARAANKRQQLELRQRQLDQQKARFEKARAVTEIVQSTALAVVNALTQVKALGPGAIALAALIGAIGAVQIARVLAQPIPRYAEGTPEAGHPGGLAVVGDAGKAEGIKLPDGSVYKSPAKDTLVDLPKGTKVFPDYSNMTKPPVYEVAAAVDTTQELRRGFGSVVHAIKRIPQPIIKSERAWTVAHRTGSSFRNYLNRSI